MRPRREITVGAAKGKVLGAATGTTELKKKQCHEERGGAALGTAMREAGEVSAEIDKGSKQRRRKTGRATERAVERGAEKAARKPIGRAVKTTV